MQYVRQSAVECIVSVGVSFNLKILQGPKDLEYPLVEVVRARRFNDVQIDLEKISMTEC